MEMESYYPTNLELDTLQNWDPRDFWGLVDFLKERWTYPDYVKENGKYVVFSTGGWSGNEDLIDAICPVWLAIYNYMWKRGGHFTFKAMKEREAK